MNKYYKKVRETTKEEASYLLMKYSGFCNDGFSMNSTFHVGLDLRPKAKELVEMGIWTNSSFDEYVLHLPRIPSPRV